MEVALSEALSNAFFHAYRGTPGPVHVEIVVENSELTLLVRDEGPPLAAPPTVPATLREAVGRGTLVRLVKRLESPLPGPTGDFHPVALIGQAGTTLQGQKAPFKPKN